MSSASLFDRLTNSRNRSPILPLHKSPRKSPSEYQLTQLDPRPDSDPHQEDDLPREWLAEQEVLHTPREPSPMSSREKSSTRSSSSRRRPKPMFAGPPPPISASVMISQNQSRIASTSPASRGNPYAPSPARRHSGVASLIYDHGRETTLQKPDSVWRGLHRQEKALEQDVQRLLDQQAAALIAGSGNDKDAYSTGSSTPTGTFYSTKSSKSRMTNSLYVPTRATPDGNVIPVRQPSNDQTPGLRSTRASLRKLINTMAKLKREENAHLEDALNQRQEALSYLNQLSTRRGDIQTELHSLEEDSEEPLGKELRELSTRHDAMSEQIRRLEEKLVGMRNQRRILRGKIDDIKNKREAGLSGYRGALKDVESEVTVLLQRPPIQPLDLEMLSQAGQLDSESASSGGIEFLRLIPERRTLEMARSWWESEISTIERCRRQVDADRQALEEGGEVWGTVMRLVTDFESGLRQLMKPGGPSPSASTLKGKGKEKMPSQEEMITAQLPRMKGVVEELEGYMQMAEEKQWNLLICTIGAELEVFKEAYSLLESLVYIPDTNISKDADSSQKAENTSKHPPPQGQERHYHTEESDNEVPPDLLGGQVDDRESESGASHPADMPPLQRWDSENEVPPEFLAEHA